MYNVTHERGYSAHSRSDADPRPFADPRRFTDPAPCDRAVGDPTNGGKNMTTVKEPVAGYDDQDAKEVIASLSSHSQVELARIESYEREHENRVSVFDKLRWLRQEEPLPGYDALSVDEVMAALAKADLAGIKRVRGYERKFGARREVLDEVDRLHRERQVPLVSRDSRS